jgi:secreted PhoX family phosphatase
VQYRLKKVYSMKHTNSKAAVLTAVCAASLLSACGGGSTTAAVTPAPTAAELTAAAVKASRDTAYTKTSVYRIGYPVEVQVTGDDLGTGATASNAVATKHYAMGRLAWELAYVLEKNGKTNVYSGDDGTNRGFFRYVPDNAQDLSSGTLYAAKLKQLSSANGGSFDVNWIDLGHASNQEIDKFIKLGVQFSDLFNQAAYDSSNKCPVGFLPSEADGAKECLQVRSSNDLGMTSAEIHTAASRLEALRYAAINGATHEFRKFEGVTSNAAGTKLFVAMSDVGKAMAAAPTLVGIDDDIHVTANKCGAVYQLNLNADGVATDMSTLVAGTLSTNDADNVCDINGIASPDNVTQGPTDNLLIIGEDTDYHRNDVMWAYNFVDQSLTRIFSTPYGSETTSPMYYRNLNGFDYMTAVVQHPYGEPEAGDPDPGNPADVRAYVGYIGPFPTITDRSSIGTFAQLAASATDTEKASVRATTSFTYGSSGSSVTRTIGFNTLFRSGDDVGGVLWGQHVNAAGLPMDGTAAPLYSATDYGDGISTSPDHTSLLVNNGKIFSITQFEEGAGMMYISALSQDTITGELTATATKPVDLSKVYGGYTFCAGMPTPWGTHLGGEEYPTNANSFEKNANVDRYFDPYLEYFGFDPNAQP